MRPRDQGVGPGGLRSASLRSLRRLPVAFVAMLLGVPLLSGTAAPAASAAAPSFAFNWTGTPAAAQPWVPAPANDWDLLLTSIDPTDEVKGGTFAAGHGADCGAPPATHPVSNLSDTAYICNNHMMTAANDTQAFFTPNRLADFSQGTSTVTFQVSTERLSSRDWWEIWVMPFAENYMTPSDDAPGFNGNPPDALHIVMSSRTGCSLGQPSWGVDNNNGSHQGTFFEFLLYQGGNLVQKGGGGDCMEDAAGGVSAKTRSTFQLDLSQHHTRFMIHGAARDATWIDDNMNLPFNQAVVMWAHRSYNPSKACGFDGTCGPNTFHWSNVAITPSLPFTMLRPNGVSSIHSGSPTTVTLPAPAPANSFLRFNAFGSVRVAYNGGGFQAPHMQDDGSSAGAASSYFSPVPPGTRTIGFQLAPRGGNQPWIQDVSVWASTAPVNLPAPPPPLPVQAPPAPVQAPPPPPVVAPVQAPPPKVRHRRHVPSWIERLQDAARGATGQVQHLSDSSTRWWRHRLHR